MTNINSLSPVNDLRETIIKPEKWLFISYHDIKQRYRRSVLGPFWVTISTGVIVFFLGFLYAKLFNEPLSKHLPYVAGGLISWNYISSILNESCETFVSSSHTMKQLNLPNYFYVFRLVSRNIIILLHNLILFLIIYIFFNSLININFFFFLPFVLIIYFLAGVSVSMIFGILCLRFRDFTQIIISLTQLSFFMTPILWNVNILDEDIRWLVEYNPFYHFIEIIRSPFLDQGLNYSSITISTMVTLLLFIFSFLLLKKFHKKLNYWL